MRTLPTILAMAACAAFTTAVAAPVQWTVGAGGNAHYYDVITGYYVVGSEDPYAKAFTDVQSRSYLGMPGYVVTITSAAENAFVAALAQSASVDNNWFIIGATDLDTPGIFRWVGGPEAGQAFYDRATGAIAGLFSSFDIANGEPNNFQWLPGQTPNYTTGVQGAEPYVFSNYHSLGLWNDSSLASRQAAYQVTAYVVEYSPIPSPGGLPLLLTGLAALGMAMAFRRKAA
jgi:hypothetical protein